MFKHFCDACKMEGHRIFIILFVLCFSWCERAIFIAIVV